MNDRRHVQRAGRQQGQAQEPAQRRRVENAQGAHAVRVPDQTAGSRAGPAVQPPAHLSDRVPRAAGHRAAVHPAHPVHRTAGAAVGPLVLGAGQLLQRAGRVHRGGHQLTHMETDRRVGRPQGVDTQLDVQEEAEGGAHGRRTVHGVQQRRGGRPEGERHRLFRRVRVRTVGVHFALHGRFQTRGHIVGRGQGVVERRPHGECDRCIFSCRPRCTFAIRVGDQCSMSFYFRSETPTTVR